MECDTYLCHTSDLKPLSVITFTHSRLQKSSETVRKSLLPPMLLVASRGRAPLK